MGWQAANVRKGCTCDKTFWISTDVLQDAQAVLELGSTQRSAEQELDKKRWTNGDAMKLETFGNRWGVVQELDVSLKKRKIGEPDVNPGGASSLTADTPKRGESEQGSSAENENLLAGCTAALNKLLCDTPSVDLSRHCTALSGKFSEGELKAGRELELRNMFNFDAFELVD